jgi:urease accessory protein
VNETALLRLLQLADSAIPIGGAAHSFGLETLADEGLLDASVLAAFLGHYLEEAGAMEGFFVRRAYRGENLTALSAELSARKPARESREASLKLGRRFAMLVNSVVDAPVLGAELHYPVAFGAAALEFGIAEDASVQAYLQQSITGLVSACQRLMPLGQSAAARIVWNLKPAIIAASCVEEIRCFSPLPEIASMRHGNLETRLFIS